MRAFASDNYAGVHPQVLAAIAEANADHAVSYGDDPWTEALRERVRSKLGAEAELHLVFNGTAANVLAIEALTQPWEAVLCAASSHLNVDECGAPERAGRKLLAVPAPDGRLAPAALEPLLVRIGDQHVIQPRVVSVTQSTELGTRYPLAALRELATWAHARGLLLHLDGARLFNAAAGLGVGLDELTTGVGADAVSLGATKNGAMGAEAVVFLRPGLAPGFPFLRKQGMQLASKMRFMAAQLLALLEGDLWRANAAHANAMAQRLAAAVRDVDGVRVTHPVEANAVFAVLPDGVAEPLAREWPFYVWDEATGEVRWMCSWDTRAEDVDAFAAAVRTACARSAAAAA
jgi:threonine aldolase